MSGFNLSGWALRNRSLVLYFMIAAVIAGVGAFVKLGRNEDPAFTFRTMVVVAEWPGATLEDTLLQVTERLERKLQETPHLDFLRSFSRDGHTTIFVNLKGETPPAEVPEAWYQVRKKIGDIRHTLPQGVLGPFFNDEFGDTYGIIYGFIADGFTHRELRDFVEEARSRLLQVPDVSKIEIIGAQEERIFVEFSTETLAGLGIDPSTLIAALQAQNAVRPAGVVQTGFEALSLRVSGAFRSEADVLAVNFVAGDRVVPLGDIATVRRGFADPPQPMFRVDGQPAIGLGLAMRDGGDILQLGLNVRKAMAGIVAELPVGVEARLVADQPVTVQTAIGEFTDSLWQAIVIILVVSFIALGVRAGSVVALAIPLTLAIVFVMMSVAAIDLQRISLGALIIALALMVDDAMTTVDAMIRRLAAGDTMEKAASFAYETLAFAMLAGTFITIAGFVPIGFAKSSAGEYTFSIFAVVGIALVVSWFVAVIFAPLIGTWVLKPPPAAAPGAAPAEEKAGRVLLLYQGLLVAAMRARWLTIAVTVALFVVAVVGTRIVPQQFFPSSDRPELVVDLSLPQNASIHATRTLLERLDEILKQDKDVKSWSSYVGRGAIRFYLPLNVQLANAFFGQIVIVAKGVEERERVQARLEKALLDGFPDVVSRIAPLELGPPVGWPVQYRVAGPDPAEVRAIALGLAQTIAAVPGASHVSFDWMEPARELRIQIDQDEARRLGLNSAAVASVLNAAITGATVTQVRDSIYLINVVARADEDERVSLTTLRTLQVPLPGGRTVPLSAFASFEYGQDQPLVWRRDRVPTLTVQADVAPGAMPEAVVAALEPAIAALNAKLPAGYRIDVGGTVEESQKSRDSVLAVVPAMMLIMITVLMFQTGSFARLFLVLSVMPMGLIGVVAALLASGRPLGFVAILGCLALLGMIAKNAVILIAQIEAEREAGKSIWDAVVAASTSRFRPIMLTAVSTVLGMIPIAPTVFWGPMAFAIMGGLLVATMLTLVFLPALYVTIFRVKAPDRAVAATDTPG